ncbi:uncharacterized protein LOC111398766 [Olea europaea var. sylvestris]|uniref:uncharacterized protein LOC111398766 n=1 Tax=Olea europaea var. sylvestris TaxID=158386 RepID=UPI000C1D7622|nr:uncharacterized protein LOC111398766 [Olea europaea var. sylvestris]
MVQQKYHRWRHRESGEIYRSTCWKLFLGGWCTYWLLKTREDEHVRDSSSHMGPCQGILKKPANTDQTNAVFVYPTMLIALVCSLLSVKYDVKKAARSDAARPVAKPMLSFSKLKLR